MKKLLFVFSLLIVLSSCNQLFEPKTDDIPVEPIKEVVVIDEAPLFEESEELDPTYYDTVFEEAFLSNDPSKCDVIEDIAIKQKCKDNFLPPSYDEVVSFAIEFEDTSLCEDLDTDDEKQKCITEVEEILETLSINSKNDALIETAVKENNENLCETILDTSRIDECKEAVTIGNTPDALLMQEAIEKKDPTLCEQFSTDAQKENCKLLIKAK